MGYLVSVRRDSPQGEADRYRVPSFSRMDGGKARVMAARSPLRGQKSNIREVGGTAFYGRRATLRVKRTGRKRKLMRRRHLCFQAEGGAGIYFRKLLASMLIMAAACAAPGC